MSDNCQNHSGHTAQMEALTHSQIEINASIREIVKGQHEIRERVATVESSSKSAHHRLDTIEDMTQSIHEMSFAVKQMAQQMAEMLKLIKDQDGKIDVHDKRIDTIEKQPGIIAIKAWLFVAGFFGTAFLSFIIGLSWAKGV